MLEVIEGKGRLEATTPPEKIWEVSYRFEFTTRIVKKPGLPRVASKGENRGVVESLDGKPIPEGDYQLQTEDGEILHVQNVGLGNWMIPRTRVRVLKRVLEAAYFAHLAHVHTLKTQELICFQFPWMLRPPLASASKSAQMRIFLAVVRQN
jgi:hypothetical protein